MAADRAAPAEDALIIETWYDRIGWQRERPDFTSKGIWETAGLERNKSRLQSEMMERYVSLRAETPEYVKLAAEASVTQLVKESFADGFSVAKAYGVYLRRIRRACSHRALFVTGKGYTGLAP